MPTKSVTFLDDGARNPAARPSATTDDAATPSAASSDEDKDDAENDGRFRVAVIKDRRTRWSAWSEHDKRIDDDNNGSTLKDEANDADSIQTTDSGAYVVAAGSSFSRADEKRTHRILRGVICARHHDRFSSSTVDCAA